MNAMKKQVVTSNGLISATAVERPSENIPPDPKYLSLSLSIMVDYGLPMFIIF